MRLWWVSMSLFMELAGEQGKVVRSISTSIQLLSMEEVFSMSKWSDRVSRRPSCARNCESIAGWFVVFVVVYLLLGQSRE